ncbi:MAG: hypothetical protein CR217_07625 [Beijerinckiaceae bacterium]|nr:MAG: hypothetical protein CR217_07625 [Beijerinckiaceae bacterium]
MTNFHGDFIFVIAFYAHQIPKGYNSKHMLYTIRAINFFNLHYFMIILHPDMFKFVYVMNVCY